VRAIVVGDPRAGGVAACAALPVVGALAWPDTATLRLVADELSSIGWEAMVVDPDDLSFSTSSMSLLSQLHGSSDAVVVHLDDTGDVHRTVDTAVMTLRHLPPVPVILTGTARDQVLEQWGAPSEALELGAPGVADHAALAEAWDAAVMPITTGQES